MFRISNATAAILLLSASSVFAAFGCQVLAGIDEKELRSGSGGSGGSGSSSSSSSSSASSSGGPDLFCNMNPGPSPLCKAVPCMGSNPLDNGCHCGGCNRDCGYGPKMGCMSGVCQPKLLAQLGGVVITRASTNSAAVFFPAFDEKIPKSNIRAVLFDGFVLPNPITTKPVDGYIYAIDSDCDSIYFATRADQSGAEEALYHVPMKGGDSVKLPKPSDNDVAGVESIVHDATKVFWTDFRGVGVWVKGSNTAKRIDAPSEFHAIGLAIDGVDLYWSEAKTDGTKSRIRHGTITPDFITVDGVFLEYDGAARQLGVDATRIYWIDTNVTGQDSIQWMMRNTLSGQQPLFIPVSTKKLGDPILVDYSGDFVYYIETEQGPADTYRIPKLGGAPMPEPVSLAGFNEQWLIGDAKRIYMVTPKNGTPESGQIDWVAR